MSAPRAYLKVLLGFFCSVQEWRPLTPKCVRHLNGRRVRPFHVSCQLSMSSGNQSLVKFFNLPRGGKPKSREVAIVKRPERNRCDVREMWECLRKNGCQGFC